MPLKTARLVLFALLLLVAGCGGGGSSTTGDANSPATSIPVTTTTVPPATTAPVQPWKWGIDSVDLANGVALGPCEGDADLIACLTGDGSTLGSAELLVLPVENFDVLNGVDDPMESIELIASAYIATFSEDRQSVCPDLQFEELVSQAVTVSESAGLRFGFHEADGEDMVELNVIYGVRIGDNLQIFGFPAIALGACLSNEGELSDPELLDSLVPVLDPLMAVVESG